MYFTELSRTAGLLFMPVVCLGELGNRFPIGNFRYDKFNRQFIIVLNTPFHRIQMELTLTGKNQLFQFLRILY